MPRRGRGEGSVTRRHDHPSCPPADENGERPKHNCRGRWVAQLDLGYVDGKRTRKAFYGHSRTEAARKLQKALAEQRDSQLVLSSPTVETWMRYWLDVICAERGTKINTLRGYRSKVERYIIPALGSYRLDKLQPEHVRAMYVGMRQRDLAEATLRQTHAILRRALAVAVRERKVGYNVATMLDPPGTETKKRDGLTLDQARRVLSLAGDNPRWYLALYLGMRQGECLALRWCDVNLDEGWLQVRRSLVRNPDDSGGIPKGLVLDVPKSKASRRYVPLPTVVLSRLKVAHARHLAEPHPPARIYDVRDRAWVEVDDFVFHRLGQPVNSRTDWQAWIDLLDTAEVPRVALHAARNTTASLLEAARVPDRMVAEILGQSSVAVTHGYQAADIERRRAALAELEALVSGD